MLNSKDAYYGLGGFCLPFIVLLSIFVHVSGLLGEKVYRELYEYIFIMKYIHTSQ